MTDPHPQPEYIITTDELQKLMSWSTHKSPGVCQYERRLEILKRVQSRPHTHTPAAPVTEYTIEQIAEIDNRIRKERKSERERVQPLVDFVRNAETKNREMADLMRRNGMKIDNLDDPMQKLAFTFYSEIGEMSHKAEIIITEYAESLRGGA